MARIFILLVMVLMMPVAAMAEELPLPEPSPPSAPTGLVSTIITQTSIGLSWHHNPSSDNVTHYNIYKDGVYLTSTNQNNYTVETLEPGREYQLYISALNYDGEGPASIVLIKSTNPIAIAPSNLRATNIGSTEVSVAWDGQSLKYVVYLEGQEIGQTTNNYYRLTGLESENEYWIFVVGLDGEEESEPSNVLTVTTAESAIPLSAITLMSDTWNYVWQLTPFLFVAIGIGFTFALMGHLGRIFSQNRYY